MGFNVPFFDRLVVIKSADAPFSWERRAIAWSREETITDR